jgi:hypothetical protein
MSIYKVINTEIPIIAYSVIHQANKSVTSKEYVKSMLGFRTELKEESDKIQATWQSYLSDFTAKTVQTTRGNLSQFLSTPIQSDTGEIQHIISDQIGQTAEQLLPKTPYGIADGYDGKFLTEVAQVEIPKTRALGARSFFQNIGFKIGRNSSAVFESLYLIHGASNLDILEYLVRKRIGNYNSSHGTKADQSSLISCALYNLLFLDGSIEKNIDRFELQVRFAKGKESYELFHNDLHEAIKALRLEIHDLNVSVWQKKLGLGQGSEYTLLIRTKDRSTLRGVIAILQKLVKLKNFIPDSIGHGIWLVKEIF